MLIIHECNFVILSFILVYAIDFNVSVKHIILYLIIVNEIFSVPKFGLFIIWQLKLKIRADLS